MDIWSLKNSNPRPEQMEIINEITSAIDSDYENIVLEAGTGIGKSAIATSISNYVNCSYICTMTNQLQEQYLNDFNYMLTEIKGRGNYPCNNGGYCDKCPIKEHNKLEWVRYEKELEKWEKEGEETEKPKPNLTPVCTNCEYLNAFNNAKSSPCVITNYDYLFYAGNYANQWGTRDLIVLDEAHNFEKKVMSLVSESLNRTTIFKKYHFDIFEEVAKGGALKNIKNSDYWLNIVQKCIEMELYQEEPDLSRLASFKRIRAKLLKNDFIIDLPMRKEILVDKDKSARLKVEFIPVSGGDYSHSLLQFGDIRMFMTGTLGNVDKFCEWNGLDQDDTYYIYAKSPFPVENRPIIKQYVCSMKQGQWNNPHIIKYIQRIMSSHQGEKGVIHTSSNQQAWWIKKQLNSNKVWVAYGGSRADTISAFEDSSVDLTLVGAGLKDGVDFKGDKCRYQILFKVPYPNIGNEQVKVRKELDLEWYIYNTVMPLMQAYGRGIRDIDDYCKFYVLDEDFEHILHEYDYLLNEYFLEAIQ